MFFKGLMMIRNLKLIFLISFLFGCSNDEHVFYFGEIDKTSKKCIGNVDLKYIFKLDVKRQQVMTTVTDEKGERIISTFSFENCKIFDNKNFICSDSPYSVTDGRIHYKYDGVNKFVNEDSTCWYKKSILGFEFVNN